MTGKLSDRQRRALAWVAGKRTIPPTEPSTWKSLINRGLIEIQHDGFAELTDAGKVAHEHPAPARCDARFTVASGVQRGERVQCLKAARAGSSWCATHRPPWER